MTQQIPSSNPRFNNNTISSEQLNQIIEAILAGKYSWACVLLLRCAGYNPLNYIPYRTYNRLLKDNCQIGGANGSETSKRKPSKTLAQTQSNGTTSKKHLNLVSDLAYLEDVSKQDPSVRGGHLEQLLNYSWQNVKWLHKFQDVSSSSW